MVRNNCKDLIFWRDKTINETNISYISFKYHNKQKPMVAFSIAYQILTFISVIMWNATENPAKYPIDDAVNWIVVVLGFIVTSYFVVTGIRVLFFFKNASTDLFQSALFRVRTEIAEIYRKTITM
jgi:hypothetical protein